MATDPFIEKQVDKSEAYIVLQKANGEVACFESEANYHAFVKWVNLHKTATAPSLRQGHCDDYKGDKSQDG